MSEGVREGGRDSKPPPDLVLRNTDLILRVLHTLQQPLQNPQVPHLSVGVRGQVVEEGLAHLSEDTAEAEGPGGEGRRDDNPLTHFPKKENGGLQRYRGPL